MQRVSAVVYSSCGGGVLVDRPGLRWEGGSSGCHGSGSRDWYLVRCFDYLNIPLNIIWVNNAGKDPA